MKSWLGVLQVLLSGACFGFLGVFGKLAYQYNLSVGELLTFRFSFATLLLFVFLFIFRRSWLLIERRQMLISLLLGFFGYAVFSTLYFLSIKGITVGLAALLLFTFPIHVSLGSFLFFREPLTPSQILSLALSSVGLICLVWGDWAIQNYIAVIEGLLAALTYAAYVLISGKVQQNVRPLSSSLYVMAGAAAGLFVLHRPSPTQLLQGDLRQWAIVFGIAVICTITPLTLFLAGLQKMSSSRASLLVMVEPVVAAMAGAFLFSETMSLLQTLGGIMIVTSLIIQAFGNLTTGVAKATQGPPMP